MYLYVLVGSIVTTLHCTSIWYVLLHTSSNYPVCCCLLQSLFYFIPRSPQPPDSTTHLVETRYPHLMYMYIIILQHAHVHAHNALLHVTILCMLRWVLACVVLSMVQYVHCTYLWVCWNALGHWGIWMFMVVWYIACVLDNTLQAALMWLHGAMLTLAALGYLYLWGLAKIFKTMAYCRSVEPLWIIGPSIGSPPLIRTLSTVPVKYMYMHHPWNEETTYSYPSNEDTISLKCPVLVFTIERIWPSMTRS